MSTPYDAWKHFIDESLLRIIAKFTTEEAARRGDNEFVLDLHHLETFIGLQYARGLYGKVFPPVSFGVGSMACLFSLKQ